MYVGVLYIPYMDPLIVLLRFFLGHRNTAFLPFFLRGRPAVVHHLVVLIHQAEQPANNHSWICWWRKKKPSKYKNKSNSNEHLETESLMLLMFNPQYSFIIFVGPVAPHQTHVNVHVHTCLAEFCRSPPPRRNMTMEMNNNLAINFFLGIKRAPWAHFV